jgi:hypothetical protein
MITEGGARVWHEEGGSETRRPATSANKSRISIERLAMAGVVAGLNGA